MVQLLSTPYISVIMYLGRFLLWPNYWRAADVTAVDDMVCITLDALLVQPALSDELREGLSLSFGGLACTTLKRNSPGESSSHQLVWLSMKAIPGEGISHCTLHTVMHA